MLAWALFTIVTQHSVHTEAAIDIRQHAVKRKNPAVPSLMHEHEYKNIISSGNLFSFDKENRFDLTKKVSNNFFLSFRKLLKPFHPLCPLYCCVVSKKNQYNLQMNNCYAYFIPFHFHVQ